jgi:hypothetical protein
VGGFNFNSVSGARFDATTQAVVYWIEMREILEIEEHIVKYFFQKYEQERQINLSPGWSFRIR